MLATTCILVRRLPLPTKPDCFLAGKAADFLRGLKFGFCTICAGVASSSTTADGSNDIFVDFVGFSHCTALDARCS